MPVNDRHSQPHAADVTANVIEEVAASTWMRKQVRPPGAPDETEVFLKSAVIGALNANEKTFEFLAKPNSVNDALRAFGSSIRVAAEYYSSKLLNNRLSDIATDAGSMATATQSWMKDFEKRPAAERGEAGGELAYQFLLGEVATIGCASLMARGLSGFERSSYTMCELPERARLAVGNAGSSEQFQQFVQKLVDELPDDITQMLAQRRIALKTVDHMAAIDNSLGANVRAAWKIDHGTVYIGEWFKTAYGIRTCLDTTPRVLRHEIGHIVDRAGNAGDWLTDSPEFVAAYRNDLARLSKTERRELEHYAVGNARGRKEVFAELYAHQRVPAVRADGMIRHKLKHAFPSMNRLIEESDLPGGVAQ